MDATTTKVLSMGLLGGISFLIGALTWKLSGSLKRKTGGRKETVVTSLLLCFGAGVLLATCLLHILPEAREGLEDLAEEWEVHWLAELVLCIGFFLVYFIEELVHTVLHKIQHKEEIHRTFSMRKSANLSDECGDATDTVSTLTASQGTLEAIKGCCESEAECHNDMERRDSDESGNNKYNPKYEVRLSISTNSMFPNYHAQDTVDVKSEESGGKVLKSGKHKSHHDSHTASQTDSIIKDIITVLALSFHAVFEGIAVGVEQDTNDVWTLFTAISIHKFVITFCLCVELLQSKTKTQFYFLYLTTFSLVSPLGIAVGILISEMGENAETHALVVGIFQGLAAGTIIYVVMFEVLQREKERSVSGVLQLLAVILGFAVIMTLELVGGHDHHEDDAAHSQHLGNFTLADHHLDSVINDTFVPLEDADHDLYDHDHDNQVDEGYLVLATQEELQDGFQDQQEHQV